jgi:hypothetical protein
MIKKTSKKTGNKSSAVKGLQLSGVSIQEIIEACSILTEDFRISTANLIVACFLIIGIQVQIRLSMSSEKAEYFDRLPSYKMYKQTGLQGSPGRTLATIFAFYRTSPVIPDLDPEKASGIVDTVVTVPTPNTRRIMNPTPGNWSQFFNGELAAALGFIISCPSTNIKMFGFDATWIGDVSASQLYDKIINQAKTSTSWNAEFQSGVTKERVFGLVKNAILTDAGGLPRTNLHFAEPVTIQSNIEKEILGDFISRDGTVRDELDRGGELPSSTLTEEMLIKHLTPIETVQYKAAIKYGLKEQLKSLNARVRQRVNRAEKKQSLASAGLSYSAVSEDPVPMAGPQIAADPDFSGKIAASLSSAQPSSEGLPVGEPAAKKSKSKSPKSPSSHTS